MKLTEILISFIFMLHLLNDVLSNPLPPRNPYSYHDYDNLEERRKRNKRKRRPCTRNNQENLQNKGNNQEDARWFLGHDLTLYLGDVTICGNFPHNDNNDDEYTDPGIFGGIVPVLQRPPHNTHIPQRPIRPHKPHRPHRPHRPLRPSNNKPEEIEEKPVSEQNEDDYVEDNYYKPGPVVGVLNNQIVGQEQNLSNFNPSRFFSMISGTINRYVNPWVDLFFR